MANKNRHKIVAVFVAFLVSSFSISLSFSPCVSLFPAFPWHLGTPKQPTKWGYRKKTSRPSFSARNSRAGDGCANSMGAWNLRGPVAILFISRDTCSDSIAKLLRALFCGGIAQLSRDMLQNGVSHRCVCAIVSTKGGYRTILGEC